MRRLLIRPGGIGDCILCLPALESLKTDYTEVWAPSPVVPLIRFADRVRPLSSTGIDLVGIPGIEPPPGLLANLRGFDSIVSWYGSNRDEFRAALLGLPVRFLAALPDAGGREHCADFFANQTGAGTPAIPRIQVHASQGEYAAIHPFSGSARKNWPLDRYRELASRLPFPVQWCAGPEQVLEGAERFDNLYELAGWIGGSRVYVGNDSGITHLAAAVGAPVVSIFGPTDPAVWSPRGEKVRVVHADLEAITVERVLNAVHSLL